MKVQVGAVISHVIMFFAGIWIGYHTDHTIPIHRLDHIFESHNIFLVLDWQTCNNAIFGAKSFSDTFPIVLISAIHHLAI